jgi:predicted RNA-binding Zn-ribbon protein involved in translation (DUF1610 family)
MSRSRARKPPPHACDDQRTTFYVGDEHGEEKLAEVCGIGRNQMLAAVEAEWTFDCPACGAPEAYKMRIGRQWLGEPRFIWRCEKGCTPAD